MVHKDFLRLFRTVISCLSPSSMTLMGRAALWDDLRKSDSLQRGMLQYSQRLVGLVVKHQG